MFKFIVVWATLTKPEVISVSFGNNNQLTRISEGAFKPVLDYMVQRKDSYKMMEIYFEYSNIQVKYYQFNAGGLIILSLFLS